MLCAQSSPPSPTALFLVLQLDSKRWSEWMPFSAQSLCAILQESLLSMGWLVCRWWNWWPTSMWASWLLYSDKDWCCAAWKTTETSIWTQRVEHIGDNHTRHSTESNLSGMMAPRVWAENDKHPLNRLPSSCKTKHKKSARCPFDHVSVLLIVHSVYRPFGQMPVG